MSLARRDAILAGVAASLALSSCAKLSADVTSVAPPWTPPLPFDEAVYQAANAVLAAASAKYESGPVSTGVFAPQAVVIDPLIDGVTGEQTAATRTIGMRITDLARQKYPRFTIQPFAPQIISTLPHVMIGTFTPVNVRNEATGTREAFRFCLIMADLHTGTVVARKWTRATLDGIDSTPSVFFRDSPTWTDDTQTQSYINSCQKTKVGDPIDPRYLEGILTASIISEAIDAYATGRYADAVDLYTAARSTVAGRQLRVFNGLYLANWRLGRQSAARTAFGDSVDYGLENHRLGVKMLFRPGSVALDPGPDGHPYDMWIQGIADQAAKRPVCMQVIGNTSKTGPVSLNDRLSRLRADYIKTRLESAAPSLSGRLVAFGAGANNNLIGTGADSVSDALDRRVEFKVGC